MGLFDFLKRKPKPSPPDLSPAQQVAKQKLFEQITPPAEKERTAKVEQMLNIPSSQRLSGGGSSSSKSTPQTPPPTVSPQVAGTNLNAKQVAAITAEAKVQGVSPQVLATRLNQQLISEARTEALRRGVPFKTEVERRNFITQLRKEEKQQTIKPKQQAPIRKQSTEKQPIFTKVGSLNSKPKRTEPMKIYAGTSSSSPNFLKNFLNKINYKARSYQSSPDPVKEGIGNIYFMGKDIISPSIQTISLGANIGKDIIQPTIQTIDYGRMMLSDLAQPTKQHLTDVYGKPKDQSVTRWLATSVPAGIGSKTEKTLQNWGFTNKTIDLSMPKDLLQPTLTTAELGTDIFKNFWATATDTKQGGATTFSNPIPKEFTFTPSNIGKGAETTAKYGQYLVPVYGEGLIFGSAVESLFGGALGGEKSLKSYVKAHPLEAGIGAGYGALKLTPAVLGYVRTRGRTEIDINRLVPEDVLSGKKRFPEAGRGSPFSVAKEHKKLFENTKFTFSDLTGGRGLNPGEELFKRSTSKQGWVNLAERNPLGQFKKWTDIPKPGENIGFHATGKVFWKGGKVEVGEAPLHISSSVSPNFLGISGEGYSFNFLESLKSPFKRSGVMIVNPKGFKINVGYEVGRAKGYKWSSPTEPGIAYIPGTKKEIQALLETGTGLEVVSQKYFSRYKGVRFPIDYFRVIDEISPVTKGGKNVQGSRVISYSGLPRTDYTSYKSISSVSAPGQTKSVTSTSITPTTSSIKLNSYMKAPSISSLSYSPTKSPYKSPVSSKSSLKSSPRKPSSPSYTPSSSKVSKTLSYSYSKSSRRGTPPSYYLGSSSSFSSSGSKKPDNFIIPIKFKPSKPTRTNKGFSVFVRRQGVFRPIGTGLSLKKAFELGRTRTARTLGASFKVTGGKGLQLKTPKGFYKKKERKEGIIFIEQPKFRLSTGTEKREIKLAKLYAR